MQIKTKFEALKSIIKKYLGGSGLVVTMTSFPLSSRIKMAMRMKYIATYLAVDASAR